MEKLGINLGLLITQAINFFIMLGVLTFLLYRPILNALEKRRKEIQKGIDLTAEMEKEKEEMDKTKKRMVDEVKQEGQRIIKQAIIEANKKSESIISEEKKKVGVERVKMLKEIDQEKEKAVKKVQKQAMEYAVLITERIINKQLTKQEQQRILAESLKKIKQA